MINLREMIPGLVVREKYAKAAMHVLLVCELYSHS